MNGIPVSETEIATIQEMKLAGKTNKEIAALLNRSMRTVQRASSKFMSDRKRADWGVYCLLTEQWDWDKPEKKPKKEHSWFITPYNYPRMWTAKEE